MPYGGVKDSGLGREGLRWAIEDMTEIRIMVLAQPPSRLAASRDGSRRVPRPATRRPSAPAGVAHPCAAMDLTLTPAQLELQARARAFVRDVLQPLEAEFERAGGRVPRDWGDPIRRAAIEARLHGGSLPGRARRPGLDGPRAGPRPRAARPGDGRPVVVHPGRLQRAGPLRRRSSARATSTRRMRGERSGSYAITEDGAGSDARDARGDRGPRRRDRRLRPQRREVVRDRPGRHRLHDLPLPTSSTATERLPTLFLVDYDTPGRAHPARPRLHAHVRRPPPAVRARGRPRAGRRGPRRGRAGGRADQRVVRRGADPHRRALQRARWSGC